MDFNFLALLFYLVIAFVAISLVLAVIKGALRVFFKVVIPLAIIVVAVNFVVSFVFGISMFAF